MTTVLAIIIAMQLARATHASVDDGGLPACTRPVPEEPRVCAFRCDPRHRLPEPVACNCLARVVRCFFYEGCLFLGSPTTLACARRAVCNIAAVSTNTCITTCFAAAGHSCGCSNTVTFQCRTCTQCMVLCLKASVYICYVAWLALQ